MYNWGQFPRIALKGRSQPGRSDQFARVTNKVHRIDVVIPHSVAAYVYCVVRSKKFSAGALNSKYDRTVRLWDAATGALQQMLGGIAARLVQ